MIHIDQVKTDGELLIDSLTGLREKSATPFMSELKFSEIIEKTVVEKHMNYFEAVSDFCTENDIDPEEIKQFISDNLKQKIEVSAIEMGLLPKRATLFDYDE